MQEIGEQPTRGSAFVSIYDRVNAVIAETMASTSSPLKVEWTHHEREGKRDRNTVQVFAPLGSVWLPLVSRHQLNNHGKISKLWVAGGETREDLEAKDKSRMRTTAEYILFASRVASSDVVVWDLGDPAEQRRDKQRDSRTAGNSATAEGWVHKLTPGQMTGFSAVVSGILARCYAAELINADVEVPDALALVELDVISDDTETIQA